MVFQYQNSLCADSYVAAPVYANAFGECQVNDPDNDLHESPDLPMPPRLHSSDPELAWLEVAIASDPGGVFVGSVSAYADAWVERYVHITGASGEGLVTFSIHSECWGGLCRLAVGQPL